MNCLVDYEDSEDWEDIGIITRVPKPGGVLFPKIKKQKSTKQLQQRVGYL